MSGLLLLELLGLVIGITIYNQGKIICLRVLIHGLLKKSNDSSRALRWDTSNNWLPRVGSTLTVHGIRGSLRRLVLKEVFQSASGRVSSGPIFASNLHGRGHDLPAKTEKSLAFLPPLGRGLPQRQWVCFRDKAAVVHSLDWSSTAWFLKGAASLSATTDVTF